MFLRLCSVTALLLGVLVFAQARDTPPDGRYVITTVRADGTLALQRQEVVGAPGGIEVVRDAMCAAYPGARLHVVELYSGQALHQDDERVRCPA